jgi:hypothetical protein
MRCVLKIALMVILAMTVLSSCTSLKKKNSNDSNTTNNSNDKSPALTSPKVRKVWVPEKIEGDKFIEGHWMWVLERTTTWSQ